MPRNLPPATPTGCLPLSCMPSAFAVTLKLRRIHRFPSGHFLLPREPLRIHFSHNGSKAIHKKREASTIKPAFSRPCVPHGAYLEAGFRCSHNLTEFRDGQGLDFQPTKSRLETYPLRDSFRAHWNRKLHKSARWPPHYECSLCRPKRTLTCLSNARSHAPRAFNLESPQ